MAISPNVKAVAAARAAAGSNRGSNRARYEYPLVKRPTQVTAQLIKTDLVKDENYGDERYGFMKIRLTYVILVPGAEDASTAEEQERFRQQQHGRWFSREHSPIVSPPGKNAKGVTQASNLYNELCVLLNDGDPLTDAQLRKLSQSELKKWMADYNEGKPAEERISDLYEAQVYHSMETMALLLEEVERRKPQVTALIGVKAKKTDLSQKYNRLESILSLVPEDERLPDWKPFERPYDPREENDNPLVFCSVSGERLRGWEGNEGWMSNEEWAEKQVEKLGEDFRLVVDGKEYSPPYSPRYYRMALDQFNGEGNGE